MQSEFQKKWHEVRERQGSNVVAGLDPALFLMGRGAKGLPEGAHFRDWCVAFIDAVAPYVAGIKLNQAYFQGVGQRGALEEIMHVIHDHKLVVISDNKIADIGSTNDAWIFYTKRFHFDALTTAPYAGNIEATVRGAHDRNIGIITMGLMSNAEYQTEIYYTHPETGEPLWKSRVRRALEASADGIVIGGTYTKDDPAFMECLEMTNESELLYLIPGIGEQGGGVADFLASGIRPEKCMISSSRSVMFPRGSLSTPNDQAEAVKMLRDACNDAAY